MLKEGNYYYVYGTHGMPVWRSRDLIRFDRVECRLVPEAPNAARENVGGTGETCASRLKTAGKEMLTTPRRAGRGDMEDRRPAPASRGGGKTAHVTS